MHQADAQQHQHPTPVDPQAVLPAPQQALELQREASAEQEGEQRVELAVHQQVVETVLPLIHDRPGPLQALGVRHHAPARPVQDVGEQDAEQREAAQRINDSQSVLAARG